MPPKLLPAAAFQWMIRKTLLLFFFINNMVRGQWYLTKQQQALRHEVSVPTCPAQPGALPSLQIQHNQQEQHKVPMEDPALTQHQTNSGVCLQQHGTGDSPPVPKAWPLKYTVILLLQAPRRDSSAQCTPTSFLRMPYRTAHPSSRGWI